MVNYQLYSTNVLLGGQMKWDLVLDANLRSLYVSDFNLTPIDDKIVYVPIMDYPLLNFEHQYNIKNYYNSNRNIFFNTCLTGEFNNNWPIVVDDNSNNINAYSDTYDSGCKRMMSYNTYNKQFEYLCPLWLEQLNDDLTFVISIKSSNNKYTIASNSLTLSKRAINDNFHNKFVDYFKNYIDYIGLSKGDDNVLNVSFDNKIVNASGLNVTNGDLEIIGLNNVINDLVVSEQPLLNTNNILINTFKSSHLICKQLFNFNLCFNISDILSSNIVSQLLGQSIIVTVDVKIGDTLLEKRNFYTEYEHIDRCVLPLNSIYINDSISNKSDINKNVFNYLHDNEYIENIDKHKFYQPICHWTLNNNSDYIFNLYDGFSGLFVEADKADSDKYNIYENTHLYGNTPNIRLSKYDVSQNSNGWIEFFNQIKWYELFKFINNTEKYKHKCTPFISNDIKGEFFINNIKYKYFPDFGKDLYVASMCVDNDVIDNINTLYTGSGNLHKFKISNETFCYILNIYDMVLLISNDADNLSFGKMYNALHAYNNDVVTKYADNKDIVGTFADIFLQQLYKMMDNVILPHVINIDKSLSFSNAVGPSTDITEISYYKNNVGNYVVRYDGPIKPAFTKKCNTLYYKDVLNKNDILHSMYTKYNNIYEPLYPSIGYCAIKKLTDYTYSEIPSICNGLSEIKWFDNNQCLILTKSFSFSYINRKSENGYEPINNVIDNYLRGIYNVDDNTFSYIKSLYVYDVSWEYLSNTNIDDYMYSIEIKLK